MDYGPYTTSFPALAARDRRPLWCRASCTPWSRTVNLASHRLRSCRLWSARLKVYRARSSRPAPLGELQQHRFIPSLAPRSGRDIVEVPVRHHARTRGAVEYFMRPDVFRVLLDLLWSVPECASCTGRVQAYRAAVGLILGADRPSSRSAGDFENWRGARQNRRSRPPAPPRLLPSFLIVVPAHPNRPQSARFLTRPVYHSPRERPQCPPSAPAPKKPLKERGAHRLGFVLPRRRRLVASATACALARYLDVRLVCGAACCLGRLQPSFRRALVRAIARGRRHERHRIGAFDAQCISAATMNVLAARANGFARDRLGGYHSPTQTIRCCGARESRAARSG